MDLFTSLVPTAQNSNTSRGSTTVEFIAKAHAKHGTRYDYSLVEYIKSSEKVKITCANHGVFKQTATQHTSGSGCPRCSGNLFTKLTVAVFMERARARHGDRYDYLFTDFKNSKSKIKIICKEHGIFEQRADHHMRGSACFECGINSARLKIRSTTSDFIFNCVSIHGDRYDYSLVEYADSYTPIKIVCKDHGIFEQTPDSHKMGHGCSKCSKSYIPTTTEFIDSVSLVHDNKYDYSLVDYVNSKTKIKIICPKHGLFEQSATNHLSGHGCLDCSTGPSSAELEVSDLIRSINPYIEIVQSNRRLIKPLELDIYLPKFKLAIEFNGLYFHSTYGRRLKEPKPTNYHVDKMGRCRAAGITLIQIFEDEWLNPIKQEIWKSIITNKLGKTENKVYARKCEIRDLTWKETKEFLDANHLMGADSAPIRYGLFFRNELQSVLTFAKPSLAGGNKSFDFNLSRFAVHKNTSVVGGFSKLLKYFQRLHPGAMLQTAADLRYSTGDVYLKNGFELLHETKPNYWYWKNAKQRFHRFNFRKQVLGKKLENFDPTLTERTNMLNNGWNTIFDAGNAMFKIKTK